MEFYFIYYCLFLFYFLFFGGGVFLSILGGVLLRWGISLYFIVLYFVLYCSCLQEDARPDRDSEPRAYSWICNISVL